MTNLPRPHSDFNLTEAGQAFNQLDPRIKEWVHTREWQKPSADEEEIIHAILGESDEKLILSDLPMRDKIEAIYMAILTRLATSSKEAAGFRVLHISPIQVLIDEHYERIDEMAGLVDLPVARLHDDVSCADKARALKSPAGILLTTPAALEAFVVIRASQLPTLFGHLEYVIVEESDGVVQSERDRKFQNTLNRIDLATKSSPRRIVLTTTVGDERAVQ